MRSNLYVVTDGDNPAEMHHLLLSRLLAMQLQDPSRQLDYLRGFGADGAANNLHISILHGRQTLQSMIGVCHHGMCVECIC
jgi:hypothetical protein